MNKREFESLGNLLKDLLGPAGFKLEQRLKNTDVSVRFSDLLPEKIKKRCRMSRFENGILTVWVSEPAAAAVLRGMKESLIERLNQDRVKDFTETYENREEAERDRSAGAKRDKGAQLRSVKKGEFQFVRELRIKLDR